jgi:hypothetical protein
MSIIDRIMGRRPAAGEQQGARVALPAWLRKNDVQLPPWARQSHIERTDVSMYVLVDTDAAVQDWIATLDLKREEIDQYWLEVIYQCIKLDVQASIARSDFDPRDRQQPVEIKMQRAPQWALANFPDRHVAVQNGRRVSGIERASKGREAREHYRRIRGALPM